MFSFGLNTFKSFLCYLKDNLITVYFFVSSIMHIFLKAYLSFRGKIFKYYTHFRPITIRLTIMLHFGQPTVKTHCEVYSTNRRLHTVYSQLRLGHCGLGFHHLGNQSGLCPHCGDPEDLAHVFFDCESHTVHRQDLKAAIFKLGYVQIDLR